jgi:hypothetical protein
MADAPSGGGSGWGALEVILAIILAIGLLATITGNPVPDIFGPSSSSSTTTTATKASSHSSKPTTTVTGSACGVAISNPVQGQLVGSDVIFNGSIDQCLTFNTTVPDTVVVYVTDAYGDAISTYQTLPVAKSFFGGGSFSGDVEITAAAPSSAAYAVLTGPSFKIRIPVILNNPNPVTTAPADNSGAYFVPTPTTTGDDTTSQTVTNNDTNTNTATTTTPSNTTTDTGAGGSGSRTF